MRSALTALMVVVLTGCAHQSVEVNVTATTGFEKPVGMPANPRVGFVGHLSASSNLVVIQLVREAFQNQIKVDEVVVARNHSLEPTALLKIAEIRGMAARVTILRGQPGPDDEVVLPSRKLQEAAEALPLVKTDT
jgi:hypothetical protein